MATLKEILDNAQLADNQEFTDPSGVKFSLGDLRSLSRMAEGEKQTAAQKRQEAERLAQQAATLLASLQEQADKAGKPPAVNTGDDWRKDPFYQPVVGEIDKLVATINKLNETNAATQKALDNAQAIYALERMRGQFNALPEKVRNSQKFEELARQAVSQGAKDSYGLPTLDPIIEKLREPERLEAYAASKVAEERKKWEQEQAVAASGRPGSSAKFRNVKSDAKPPIAKIEDLNSEAVLKGIADDPEFRAAMEGPLQ
jgi:hypothetical protein